MSLFGPAGLRPSWPPAKWLADPVVRRQAQAAPTTAAPAEGEHFYDTFDSSEASQAVDHPGELQALLLPWHAEAFLRNIGSSGSALPLLERLAKFVAEARANEGLARVLSQALQSPDLQREDRDRALETLVLALRVRKGKDRRCALSMRPATTAHRIQRLLRGAPKEAVDRAKALSRERKGPDWPAERLALRLRELAQSRQGDRWYDAPSELAASGLPEDGPAPLPPINRMRSGPKIDLSRSPRATLDGLPDAQLGELSRALGHEVPEGDSTDLLVRRFQQKLAVRRQLRSLLENLNTFQRSGMPEEEELLKRSVLYKALPEARQARLLQLARITHLCVRQRGDTSEYDLYFSGTQNLRDLRQVAVTAAGGVGPVYEAARELAGLVAEAAALHAAHGDGRLGLNLVAGFSMGGGVAQAFTAALQIRGVPDRPPALVLLDPQLLTNRQAEHALRATDGAAGRYDYATRNALAITLDHGEGGEHWRGLMNLMKGLAGYKSPGIVQLRLGLLRSDKPCTSGPPGLGYHALPRFYRRALERFLGVEVNPFTGR